MPRKDHDHQIRVRYRDERWLKPCSMHRAERLVRRGQAVWIEPDAIMIFLTEQDRRKLSRIVKERAGYFCVYCGRQVFEDDATVDHVLPRGSSGSDFLENLVCACRECNKEKANKPVFEYLDLRSRK